ncbi:zinc-binding domain-containing protein [Cladorrhinum sp. PSN332]|nr:zinc-binding domain-containing protein [Cladorrhinum sp. PSN332]
MRHTFYHRLAPPLPVLLSQSRPNPILKSSFRVISTTQAFRFPTTIAVNNNPDRANKQKIEPKVKSKLEIPGKPASSYTFPNLHQRISETLTNDGVSPIRSFNESGASDNPGDVYNTHVMGNFCCSNDQCDNQWHSKKVAIEIRRCGKNEYSASVYSQRCQDCNELGIMKLNEDSYVDRLVYRLKSWAGIKMEKRRRGGRPGDDPHQSQFCEGCRLGKCRSSEVD